MTQVLVVCAHPDDEAVGCGGTLRRHALAGDRITAVFLTSGESGGHGEDKEEHERRRELEARRAAKILGIRALQFWHEPDGRLRAGEGLTRRLTVLIDSLWPARIYVPHARDAHPDHRAAARLVRRAVAASIVRPAVRGFEIWTPLSRIEEMVDISEVIADKRRAIRAYGSQCAVVGFEQAFLGLARYRGEMHSWPGPYAEVFAAG
jgi:LmbE family N-acetylglucosaminyl deacetylase